MCWALCVLLGALFSSAQAQSFTDVTATWGVGDSGAGDGIAWGDYDSDGDLDLYIAYSGGGSNILYRNDGSSFYNTGQANVAGSHHGATWGDYDGDGDLDLYAPESGGNNLLYRNDGSDTFVDVASGAGVQTGGDYSPGWVDYDRDGDLDLYVANSVGANALFQNDGSGSFADVATTAAVADANSAKGAVWGDYNNDGWLDLYIANSDVANVLYENVGDGTFTDVTSTATVGAGSGTYEASWGDYDNDGDLDLHVSYYSSTPDLLYKNNSDGTFTESASGAGVGNTNNSMASTWGDFDLDGDLDLYVGNDNGANLLYSNNGNGTFTDVAAAQGVDEGGTNRTVSWADFDGDGALDIFLTNSGNSSLGVNKLFQNGSASGKSWLKVKLTGDAKNKTAIGALAVAWTGGSSQRLHVEGSSGRNSQNAPERIFGFGSATAIDSVVVRWPSGQVSASFTPAVSTTLSLTEPPLTVFSDAATVAGVSSTAFSEPVAWGDFDGDGDQDMYVGVTSAGNNLLYRNNGNSTFTDIGGSAGVNTTNNTDGAIWGDFDNDGDLDLYLSNQSGTANQLYRNNGNNTFTDVAATFGVNSTLSNHAAAWGDYDGDGDLDLFQTFNGSANALYKNEGSSFADVAPALGVDDNGSSRGVSWIDFDNDNDLDLYVTLTGGTPVFYRNDNGAFTSLSTAGTSVSSNWHGVSWGDFDNDGDYDLYLANSNAANALYRNDGSETFVEMAQAAGVDDAQNNLLGTWGDYDNDGFLDIYLVAAGGVNRLYKNQGDGTFVEVGAAAGAADATLSRSAAWADYDDDGDLDLYVTRVNGEPNRLYKNQGNSNNWLSIELEGKSSNSYGIGALVIAEETAVKQQRTLSGGSGFLSQDAHVAHFGFGTATGAIDKVTVVWSSGFSNVLTSVTADQKVLITERAVVSQTPSAGTRNVARTSNVSATFSAAVTAVDLNNFVVHGSQTGELSGAYSGQGTDNPSFNPTNDFLPGEEIEVRFADGTSAGLLSYKGTPVKGYVYRFMAAAGSGPAEFTSVFSSPFSSATHGVDLGDVDGDGDLDLVAGNAAKQNAVHLNNRHGRDDGWAE